MRKTTRPKRSRKPKPEVGEVGHYRVSDFAKGDEVLYVVTYAGTKKDHPDNQLGVVDSIGKALVYVVFNGKVSPCKPSRLIMIKRVSIFRRP